METPKKRQIMRYNDSEISLIKNTFADEDILKELRKQFLQMPSTLKLAPDSLKVLRKTLLPEIEGDAPVHQIVDLWLTLNIKERTPEDALLVIKARKMLMDYFKQEFSILEGKKARKIRFSKLTDIVDDADEMVINITARNEIVSHLEQQLAQLQVLAVQDTQKLVDEMLKNSAK